MESLIFEYSYTDYLELAGRKDCEASRNRWSVIRKRFDKDAREVINDGIEEALVFADEEII